MRRQITALLAIVPLVLAAAHASAADESKKPYPLDTCVVSGEKLGEMGDPYVFTYKDHEIKLCCKNCLKDFNKEPEKYLKKLSEKPEDKTDGGHEAHAH